MQGTNRRNSRPVDAPAALGSLDLAGTPAAAELGQGAHSPIRDARRLRSTCSARSVARQAERSM
jgi:hypothetical protein